MKTSQAEDIALKLFQGMACDDELMQRFLDMTGLSYDSLRQASQSSGFMLAVIDFISGNEHDLLALAERLKIKPEDIMHARHTLSPHGEFF